MVKRRIMIIEDDLELLSILHDLFAQQGFDVIVYPDKNSVKGVIINKPEVILLDNKLGDGFGHELCAQVKANELTSSIPVILTSGHGDLRTLAMQCGADAYLEKPFDLDALVELVKQQLQKTDEKKRDAPGNDLNSSSSNG